MTAKEHLQAGNLDQAIKALGDELRANPLDAQRRTFLFELLCFAGDYERCEKQLDVLAQSGHGAELGALLYRAALESERIRRRVFANREYTQAAAPDASPSTGAANGKPFKSAADADPRIGTRLEVFLAGNYLLVPFAEIASIEIAPPRRLRDLLWAPAIIRNAPGFTGRDLGEVLLPVLSPFSFEHPDSAVRLGRTTVWEESENGVIPHGQKMFVVDGEEIPILELRSMEFTPASSIAAA